MLEKLLNKSWSSQGKGTWSKLIFKNAMYIKHYKFFYERLYLTTKE